MRNEGLKKKMQYYNYWAVLWEPGAAQRCKASSSTRIGALAVSTGKQRKAGTVWNIERAVRFPKTYQRQVKEKSRCCRSYVMPPPASPLPSLNKTSRAANQAEFPHLDASQTPASLPCPHIFPTTSCSPLLCQLCASLPLCGHSLLLCSLEPVCFESVAPGRARRARLQHNHHGPDIESKTTTSPFPKAFTGHYETRNRLAASRTSFRSLQMLLAF